MRSPQSEEEQLEQLPLQELMLKFSPYYFLFAYYMPFSGECQPSFGFPFGSQHTIANYVTNALVIPAILAQGTFMTHTALFHHRTGVRLFGVAWGQLHRSGQEALPVVLIICTNYDKKKWHYQYLYDWDGSLQFHQLV